MKDHEIYQKIGELLWSIMPKEATEIYFIGDIYSEHYSGGAEWLLKNGNIESFPFEFWKDDNPNYPPYLRGNCLKDEIPEWVFKTQKWKYFARVTINPQKDDYGYSNYHD